GEGAGAMEPVDLTAIVHELAELYEPAAQDAGFSLRIDASPAPPVRGSRALISQAIANLLDNALKYAAGGTIIEIKVAKAAKNTVALTVADDGPGVPESDRGRIFNRFVRLETSRTTTGSGLGLSLVSAIARAHGASLTIGDGVAGGKGPGLSITLAFAAFERA
ncbi:MAG TPA: HAMP domain-containing sensor histidine kinase, partial [Parvularculaceae bacterium]|nr:HAMP domain-containing sensor histidine kinase [Parvularculaceae bacterium]